MRPLQATINALCLRHLGRLPDIENPKGYNDKIHWLKLHDQRPEQISACDKWAVRESVPDEYLIPAEPGVSGGIFPAFVKCTHDSGSAVKVLNRTEAEQAGKLLRKRLTRPYGVDKGEWAYKFAKPQLMTERALKDGTDYKFHCVHGRIAWVQVIWDRGNGTKEAIFTPDGKLTALHMDEKMVHAPREYPGDVAWAEMTSLAEYMATDWRYVRVDLYWSDERAWFGELTFWPRAGCYRSHDEPVFGEMLNIDLTQKMEPIVQ